MDSWVANLKHLGKYMSFLFQGLFYNLPSLHTNVNSSLLQNLQTPLNKIMKEEISKLSF